MTDALYKKFIHRWEEVMDLPPTSLGPLTGVYKLLTRRLKVMPLPALLAVSAGVIVGVYYLIGAAVTHIASILQRGF